MKRALWAASILLMMASAATAQTAQTSQPKLMFKHGSMVNVFGGATTSSDIKASNLGGAGFGWELTPLFAIEGNAQWQEYGLHGFGASMAAEVGLVRAHALMPFVSAGAGVFHAEFRNARELEQMPEFYVGRMSEVPQAATIATFTDPTVVFGGGLNAFLNRHWAIRPDVQEMAVMGNGQRYWMTMFAVHVAYHFEDHPITPNEH